MACGWKSLPGWVHGPIETHWEAVLSTFGSEGLRGREMGSHARYSRWSSFRPEVV